MNNLKTFEEVYTDVESLEKTDITIVEIEDSMWTAFYMNDGLKTYCVDGEGYTYGEVLKILGIDYKTLKIKDKIFKEKVGGEFPEDLKELKRKIKKPRPEKPDMSDVDPYGEEDWEEERKNKKKSPLEKGLKHKYSNRNDPFGKWGVEID